MSYDKQVCRPDKLAAFLRNYYYYGKLLDVPHLQMEQAYFNRKRWLLNRLGLGHGVLCGLNVHKKKDQQLLIIEPGMAIDTCGHEIIVSNAITIDPRELTDECGQPSPSLSKDTVHICLAYHECATDFQSVLVTDCNTPEQTMPGTIVESYRVLVREGEPEPITGLDAELCGEFARISEGKTEPTMDRRRLLCEKLSSPCPTPAENACVTLATVQLQKDGKIGEIDTCLSRRVIYSNEKLLDLILCLAEEGVEGTQGPAGPPGPSGPIGSQGPIGPVGPQGNPGTEGPQGPQGEPGKIGKQGIQGDQVPIGPQGPPGQGLDPNLTKIVSTSWEHDGELTIAQFMEGLTVTFSDNVQSIFKHDRGWFLVTVEYPLMDKPKVRHMQQATIFTQRVLDSTLQIQNGKQAFFKPKEQFSKIFQETIDQGGVNDQEILCRVVVKCTYLMDLQNNKLVDGDFGNFLRNQVSSGDDVPGGDFESWFILKP